MLLNATGITVRFGGVPALRDVDLTLSGGTVHAVLGENGAGKSTLMKVLAGAVRPDAGTLSLHDAVVDFRSPRDAIAAGIRMVHQELRLVPELSVADNIALGREPRRRGAGGQGLHRIDRAATLELTLDALRHLGHAGITIDPDAPVRTLSLAKRQLVEIAKALADVGTAPSRPVTPARVLILDEPTAILSTRECEALFAVIDHLTAAGIAIVYVTHRLDEVERVAGYVSILRDGVRVGYGPASAFPRVELIRHMVGRVPARATVRTAETTSIGLPLKRRILRTPILKVDHLSARGVHDVSFLIDTGQILGLVGLIGAGRTEVARAIMGATRITSGQFSLCRRPYAPRSPADAVRQGLGYIPEDRAGSALIPLASVRDNLTLPSLRELCTRGLFRSMHRELVMTATWVSELSIRTTSFETPVNRLSGGTQQKVVLARWLARDCVLLIADEPTRGVDVGAREEIYRALRSAADRGAGVLVITSDPEEALSLCDRIIVMRAGRIAGEVVGTARSAEGIGALMLPT